MCWNNSGLGIIGKFVLICTEVAVEVGRSHKKKWSNDGGVEFILMASQPTPT